MKKSKISCRMLVRCQHLYNDMLSLEILIGKGSTRTNLLDRWRSIGLTHVNIAGSTAIVCCLYLKK